MKKRFLSFLLNPFVLASIISIGIIYTLPEFFSKYKVKLESTEFVNGVGSKVYYSDIDGDFRSEKIKTQINSLGNASYIFYNSEGDFIDQINFNSKFLNNGKRIWFQDSDNNGTKEIYLVTKRNDSAFLNITEHRNKGLHNRKEVFVDTIVIHSENDKTYYNNQYENESFLIYESKDEVLFTIIAGFSCYPRKAYKYQNKIISSPHLTNSLTIKSKIDIDNDGKIEYLLNGNSPGNNNAVNYSNRSDYFSWFTILDDDMEFMFEPKAFQSIGSINSLVFNSNSKVLVVGYFKSNKPNEHPSVLFSTNNKGDFIKRIDLPKGWYNQIYKLSDHTFGFYDRDNGVILKYDLDLKLREKTLITKHVRLYRHDIDLDEKKEWVGFNQDNKDVTIWDPNLDNPITFSYTNKEGDLDIYGIKYINKNIPYLYFQKGSELNIFSYGKNPLYSLKYLFYLGIYGLVLLLIWLILKGQKLREAKKRTIEQRIADLQLKTIKNQVDPHFVFNAINTISEMTLMDNKLEADKFICEFSDLMRKTLSNSDKISVTLQEELDYITNYLKLQQIRLKNAFKFKVEVNNEIDTKRLVPKHVLYTFIENALKYGLPRDKQGEITVNVELDEKGNVIFLVRDNGKGLNQNVDSSISTGSGLKIIQQIFMLYTKRYGTKIDHHIKDIIDNENHISGTEAKVIMRLKKRD